MGVLEWKQNIFWPEIGSNEVICKGLTLEVGGL